MPFAGPSGTGMFNNRSGSVSSSLVKPAFRLNSRSRFQMRSPAWMIAFSWYIAHPSAR